jgi:twitching motility protein PilT
MDPIGLEQIHAFIEETCPPVFLDRWRKDNQIDYSYLLPEGGRFRVNAFYQRGVISMVFRHVKDHPPSFEDLRHEPSAMKKLCSAKDGIVLVCGPTGSGKSSTLAAMLEHINQNFDRHIVTLEDPIEFTYADDRSVFNQREIGIDAPTFQMGMKSVLRQDPDIILIGEMRDAETFTTALSAAETGHLVFGTLHSSGAQQAIQRLFEFFPPDQQNGLRRQIAGALRATITQRLVPAMEGKGRVPAVEVFMVDSLARKVIEEGSFEKITHVIEAGEDSGSRSFNQDLLRLIQSGQVSKADGLRFSPNPNALEMNLKGIFLSSGGIVQ